MIVAGWCWSSSSKILPHNRDCSVADTCAKSELSAWRALGYCSGSGPGDVMFPKPKSALTPNTYAYESEPLVKPTGFREYDARWLLGKEINLMGIQALGMGLGALIRELGAKPEIVTGHDFRSYSASVKASLIAGLL